MFFSGAVRYGRICLLVLFLLFGFINVTVAQHLNGIPVLLYHQVNNDEAGRVSKLAVTPAEFERQMVMLKKAGFQTISPDQFLSYMREEPVALPDKPILITLDDGYEDNYTYAFPILKQQDFTAVVFMVGINVDREDRLSSQQIREMSAYGITFGGHSMTHPDLTALTRAESYREIRDIQKKLRPVTKTGVDLFAYPYGSYDLRTWQLVVNTGYQAAFTVLTGLNHPKQDNIYLLRRIPVYSTTEFDALFKLLDANHPKTKLLDYSLERDE